MTTSTSTPTTPTAEPHRASGADRLLPVIAAFKLLKSALLFSAAYALHHLRHSDVENTLLDWVRAIHFDPDSHYFRLILSKATGVSPSQLHRAGIGLFCYGTLFLIEGGGLITRQRWAEYFTVLTTGLFLPLEVYELFHPGHRPVKVAVLIANLAILGFLVWNLARTRKHG